MKMTHIVKYEITIMLLHTTIMDKWVGVGDKWPMYRNVSINKQLHTKIENNHRIVTHIISIKTYQHLHNNLDYHMKADFTIIGYLVYNHFPYLAQSQYIRFQNLYTNNSIRFQHLASRQNICRSCLCSIQEFEKVKESV
jgi:hypothetical protein